MRRPFFTVSLALAWVVSACNWGTRPRDFPPANRPEGARVAVRVKGETADRIGELYAVDASGLLVRTTALTRIPWSRLAAMDVLHLGRAYDVAFDEPVNPERRDRLATVSRFPQGLDGPLLAKVLMLLSQREVEIVP